MTSMTRLWLRFQKQEYDLAKKEAKALGIPVDEFVRRAVHDRLFVSAESPWMRYAGMVESGDPRSSSTIDPRDVGRSPRTAADAHVGF
jgi:hypothetical protein